MAHNDPVLEDVVKHNQLLMAENAKLKKEAELNKKIADGFSSALMEAEKRIEELEDKILSAIKVVDKTVREHCAMTRRHCKEHSCDRLRAIAAPLRKNLKGPKKED